MNKDFIVVLLRKDIEELQLLTEGFEQMTTFPAPMLRLATQKAENIVNSLKSLNDNYTEELGAIDYQEFGAEEDEVEVAPDFHEFEKNNFDAPLDSHIEELHDEIEEYEDKMLAAEEQYIDTEKLLDEAAGLAEQKNEIPTEVDFESAKKEEFQEEMEVEELSENEEILSYPIQQVTASHTPHIEPKEEIVTETAQVETPEVIPVTNGVSVNDKLVEQGTNSLSDNLANQKIDDIRQAMNIGDRFRFQRELFNGNGEVMNKTISYLNQLAKYEEAKSFLKSKFGWSDDNPHAEEFLQLIRKRY